FGFSCAARCAPPAEFNAARNFARHVAYSVENKSSCIAGDPVQASGIYHEPRRGSGPKAQGRRESGYPGTGRVSGSTPTALWLAQATTASRLEWICMAIGPFQRFTEQRASTEGATA